MTRVKAWVEWWGVALFLLASLLAVSLLCAVVTGEEVPEPVRAGLPLAQWSAFALRSVLFTALVVGICWPSRCTRRSTIRRGCCPRPCSIQC
jgi:hypothetical protein